MCSCFVTEELLFAFVSKLLLLRGAPLTAVLARHWQHVLTPPPCCACSFSVLCSTPPFPGGSGRTCGGFLDLICCQHLKKHPAAAAMHSVH